jgi:NTE family protein
MKHAVDQQTRVGLVLGAGGNVGCAYHAGVLYSLLHHLEWDARQARSIVGTSAGSLVGALLRRGVAPDELATLVNGGPLSDVAGHLRGLHTASTADTPSNPNWFRVFRPPTPRGVWLSAKHRSTRPAMLSMLRPARFDLVEMTKQLDMIDGSEWPAGDLRICTVSARSGRRRVLTGADDVTLPTAVAASCAVPGLFAPQRVGRDLLVDGGMHSVTNADALPFGDLDEVWVIAPMAGQLFNHVATKAVRRRIGAALRHELRSVPKGMPVRVFAPGHEASDAMGIDLMSKDRSARTLLAGFLETGDMIGDVIGEAVA